MKKLVAKMEEPVWKIAKHCRSHTRFVNVLISLLEGYAKHEKLVR